MRSENRSITDKLSCINFNVIVIEMIHNTIEMVKQNSQYYRYQPNKD